MPELLNSRLTFEPSEVAASTTMIAITAMRIPVLGHRLPAFAGQAHRYPPAQVKESVKAHTVPFGSCPKNLEPWSDSNRRWPKPARAARTAGGRSVAERELGVFAHALRSPGRRERHRRLDLLDAIELAHELLDLLGDLWADRTARAGQRVCDADGPPSTSTS